MLSLPGEYRVPPTSSLHSYACDSLPSLRLNPLSPPLPSPPLVFTGVCNPTGFWDPLGFTSSPTFSVSEAKRFREAEVTHGRVAMLATIGWVLAEEYHPLFGGNIGGPAFRHFQEVEDVFPQFWELVLLAIGIWETRRASIGWNDPRDKDQMKDDYNPGEVGFDPLGLFPDDDEEKAFEIQTKEINNGRLAMIAWAGFAAQEEVDHVTIWRGLVEEHIVPAAEADLLPY
jgi:hypothetical protein